jgi:NADH:ubiquinone oxidoreductase subunit 5 (subunit L)/multisubunit Na+/H+ antiporter MnhA subunit
MWVPLAVLAVFAALLGWVGVPGHLFGMENEFEKLIHTPLAGEHAFDVNGLLISIAVALSGIVVGFLLYRNPEAGEKRLRGLLGPAWTFLEQKWYMDHLWARLLSWTMFTFSNMAAWFDQVVVDGVVFGTGRLTTLLGREVSYEHTGRVQYYLLFILLSVLILALVAGYRESAFVLSIWMWKDGLFGGDSGPGAPGLP